MRQRAALALEPVRRTRRPDGPARAGPSRRSRRCRPRPRSAGSARDVIVGRRARLADVAQAQSERGARADGALGVLAQLGPRSRRRRSDSPSRRARCARAAARHTGRGRCKRSGRPRAPRAPSGAGCRSCSAAVAGRTSGAGPAHARHGPRRAWSSSSRRTRGRRLRAFARRRRDDGRRRGPPTMSIQRTSRSPSPGSVRPRGEAVETPASAPSPCTQGPHCPADSPARYAVSRAVSATGQADSPSATSTPAPTAAPRGRSAASSSGRSPPCASQAPK